MYTTHIKGAKKSLYTSNFKLCRLKLIEIVRYLKKRKMSQKRNFNKATNKPEKSTKLTQFFNKKPKTDCDIQIGKLL